MHNLILVFQKHYENKVVTLTDLLNFKKQAINIYSTITG